MSSSKSAKHPHRSEILQMRILMQLLILCDYTLNIFGFGTVGRQKQAIGRPNDSLIHGESKLAD